MTNIASMLNIGAWGYAFAALGYTVLAFLLLTSWRGRFQGALLLGLCLLSALWAVGLVHSLVNDRSLTIVHIWLELLRDGCALLFLYKVLTVDGEKVDSGASTLQFVGYVIGIVWLFLGVMHTVSWLSAQSVAELFGYDPRLGAHLILAVGGLILVEQLFMNSRPEKRWAVKYLCIGLGGLFAYDFFLYSDAVLFKSLDPTLWDARGFIHVLVIPLIAISAARNPQWSLDVFVSRRVVFHSVAVIGAGVYLLLMAIGGYVIRYWGGSWGGIAQAIFLFGSGLVLFAVVFSGRVRAKARVFFNKHFFNYKYDYREEWLKFTGALADKAPGPGLEKQIIQAFAAIVDSQGGGLWIAREGESHFELGAAWNALVPDTIPRNDGLVGFLQQKEWLIDISEYKNTPNIYGGLDLPSWLLEVEQGWLVIPLIHNKELIGFVLLLNSRAARNINWEDRDLLKTAASQAASYLALSMASSALARARQFEAFNRLSAYVVHDLKNVVSQLLMVVENSKKFSHRADFVSDAFATVDNAVARMQKTLAQLRSERMDASVVNEKINLVELLKSVCDSHRFKTPVPAFKNDCDGQPLVVANFQKLERIIGHLVQNAQEATDASGSVSVSLLCSEKAADIRVCDTGSGMDQSFIREKLFKPFETTKGNAGMGIGVYEVREYIQTLAGALVVTSEPGKGTEFRISLPLA